MKNNSDFFKLLLISVFGMIAAALIFVYYHKEESKRIEKIYIYTIEELKKEEQKKENLLLRDRLERRSAYPLDTSALFRRRENLLIEIDSNKYFK